MGLDLDLGLEAQNHLLHQRLNLLLQLDLELLHLEGPTPLLLVRMLDLEQGSWLTWLTYCLASGWLSCLAGLAF